MSRRTKILYLLRHAKSAWDSDAVDDFSRPLNQRGMRDAPKMGKWMQKEHYVPEVIVSSPALRAWQTVTAVCYAMNIEPASVNFNKHLYLASMEVLIDIIAGTSKDVNSLLLVGHNPGMAELLEYLLADALPEQADNKTLPTATLYILQLPHWQAMRSGGAQLEKLIRPKSI